MILTGPVGFQWDLRIFLIIAAVAFFRYECPRRLMKLWRKRGRQW